LAVTDVSVGLPRISVAMKFAGLNVPLIGWETKAVTAVGTVEGAPPVRPGTGWDVPADVQPARSIARVKLRIIRFIFILGLGLFPPFRIRKGARDKMNSLLE
jgi:hypothetical protein